METEVSNGRVNEVLLKVIVSLVRKASFAHPFEEMILRFVRDSLQKRYSVKPTTHLTELSLRNRESVFLGFNSHKNLCAA